MKVCQWKGNHYLVVTDTKKQRYYVVNIATTFKEVTFKEMTLALATAIKMDCDLQACLDGSLEKTIREMYAKPAEVPQVDLNDFIPGETPAH